MVLLTVLAVGLLGLSALSLSTATKETDLAEARANARMALAMAIGQLQKQTGPDQRVTAPADQLAAGGDGSESSAAEGSRHWTGVYGSWPAGSRTRPTPEFKQWLISGEDDEISRPETANNGGSETIKLVGEGTVGSQPESFVNVPPMKVDALSGGTARIGWWTGDQGIKAAMATPLIEANSSFGAVRTGLQSAPRNAVEFATTGGKKPFDGLDPADPKVSLVTGWNQSAFLANDIKSPRGLFHDLAPFSTGLLTNVRSGGFRKDLSMHLERPAATAASTLLSTRNPALYQVGNENGINLLEMWGYYNLYKALTPSGGTTYTTGGRIPSGTRFLQLANTPAACQSDDYFFYKQPVIISYQLAISLEGRATTVNGATVNRLHVVADPILTFWNPLDVPVVIPRSAYFSVKYWQVPYTLSISINGGPKTDFPLAAALSGANANKSGDGNYLSLKVGNVDQLVFKPGEVIKVSQSATTAVKTGADHDLPGKPGFNYAGGVSLALKNSSGGFIDLPTNARVKYEARPNNLTAGQTSASGHTVDGANGHTRHFSMYHHEYYIGDDRGGNSLGIGNMAIDWDFGNKRLRPTETRGETQGGTKTAVSPRLYADRFPAIFRTLTGNDTRELGAAELNGRKAPIMLVSINAKTEMGSDLGTRYLSRFNPKALHVDFYDLQQQERDMLPYEVSVEPLLTWRNRSIEVSTNGNAYYGGAFNAEFGNSFVTTHAVPREPLVSLAAFQHSFANGFEMLKPKLGYAALNAREPMLPQIGHAIGNSVAPSMLAKSRTDGTLAGGRPLADHSYLANQALWDDWFLSGIAPQPTTFSPARGQKVVAQEFFEGKTELPVARYLANLDGRDVSQLLSEMFSGATPKDTATPLVASLMRVDGLFNVNSTSVEAWKSVLGSLKERDVIVRDQTGAESLTASQDIPVSNLISPERSVIPSTTHLDVKEASQWVGRRTLTEDQIDQLARAIVKEVRLRGPFLCLGDFINRRVGSDDKLARAGAIQSALDSDEVDINSAFQSGTRAVSGGVATRFAFPGAEEGAAGFGSPGVVKQADILTPIAPILSARSDSFVIRAYGESVDKDGKVLARAWCEATVERDNKFIDASEKADTVVASLRENVNKTFGRRYNVTAFRWLHSDEV